MSTKNNWIDEEGRVYLEYSNGELQRILRCSKPMVIKAKQRLVEYGLIFEQSQYTNADGQVANRIYFGNVISYNSEKYKEERRKRQEEAFLKRQNNVIDFIGQISTKLLILLRFFTLYSYKGIAKIIMACYMMECLYPICFGFFKLYIAAVLQGLVLIIVIMLYPAIVTNDLLTVAKTGAWTSALMASAKGIIYTIMLFDSQRIDKNIMQVN